MKFQFLIVLLSLCFFSSIQGQTNIDSLLNVQYETRDTNLFHHYTQIISRLLATDLVKAREYIDLQMDLAKDLKDPELEAFSGNVNAVYYATTSEYAKAKELYEVVLKKYEKLGNLERVSALLNNIAVCNQNLGDLDLALENQMKSLRIKDSIGVKPTAIAASLYNIGNIFFEINDIDQSTVYLKRAQKIYQDIGDIASSIQTKNLIASNYIEQKDSLDIAKKYLEECLAFYKDNKQLNNLAGIYQEYGGIAIQQNDWDTAESWYRKALVIAENNGERKFPGILYRRLAYINRERGNYELALQYGKKALAEAQELKLKKKEINDHLELASIYEAKGDYENAFESHVRYHELNDSILSNEKVLAITELETKYQTEKKEQEIVLLEEKEKSSKLKQIALLIALISVLIFLLSLWSYFRQKVKRDKLEKDKLDQEIKFKTKDLEFKKQELTAFALQLSQKNELLENLKMDIKDLNKNSNDAKSLQSLINTIQINQTDDASWDSFKMRFEQVHVGFNKRIKEEFPNLTANDLRVISLIKMNLSSKEIANILNISADGIKKSRYRLRKKLNLANEDSLEHKIITY